MSVSRYLKVPKQSGSQTKTPDKNTGPFFSVAGSLGTAPLWKCPCRNTELYQFSNVWLLPQVVMQPEVLTSRAEKTEVSFRTKWSALQLAPVLESKLKFTLGPGGCMHVSRYLQVPKQSGSRTKIPGPPLLWQAPLTQLRCGSVHGETRNGANFQTFYGISAWMSPPKNRSEVDVPPKKQIRSSKIGNIPCFGMRTSIRELLCSSRAVERSCCTVDVSGHYNGCYSGR